MTLAHIPVRTLIPLEQVIHRYMEDHAGEKGILYLPRSDWQRVQSEAASAFAEVDEAVQLSTLAGLLSGATDGMITDVRLIPDLLGPARILPSFLR